MSFELKMDKDCLALCIALARLQLLKEKLAPGTFHMHKGDIEISVEEGKPVYVFDGDIDIHPTEETVTVWDKKTIVYYKGPMRR